MATFGAQLMKSLYRYALNTLPRPVLIRLSYVFRLIAPILFRGDKVECPICNSKFSKFLSYGSDTALRPNVLCPHCLSLERHRLIWLYLNERTDFFTAPHRLLHIAPEQCFHDRFKKLNNIAYITGDLVSPLADNHFDLHDIPFDENSFDVIMCNHVLEHVNDYRRCTAELYRVLKPGGWAIMQVPIDYHRETTFEDPAIITPGDREKHYWQKDHLRLFGRDYPEQLEKSGFRIASDDFVKTLPTEQVQKLRLQEGEILYVAGK